jgi:nicotinate dehydrogenase subunit B
MPERERYELLEKPAYHFETGRRDVLKLFAGGGLLVLIPHSASAQESGRAHRGWRGEPLPDAVEAWLHIGPDGRVTAFTGKVEVGQNSRTALTQAVAEELRVAAGQVEMVMGDTALTPFDMGTFGSRTTPTMAPRMRAAGVAARQALIELAAQQWGVKAEMIEAADGRVRDPKSGRSAAYGELTHGKAITRTIGKEQISRPRGESVAKVNAREIVTGSHRYPSDIARPGMLYGKVLRPQAWDADLVSVDVSAAPKTGGATIVRDGKFVGAAAPSVRAATRALASVKAEWNIPAGPSNSEVFDYFKRNPTGPAEDAVRAGDVASAWQQAAHKVDGRYTVAYIAHVPLEPRAAVAEWTPNGLTVWTGTQRPFGVREELAGAFGLDIKKVHVLMPDCGSGYGGKHTGECAIEAARLAKATNRPVKVIWTREEEFRFAYLRPAGLIEVRGGARSDGKLLAWEFHNYNSGPSGLATPYEIPHQLIAFHPTRSPLRQGSYRGLAATANHFVRESHIDDLAAASSLDPLEFRLRNLKEPRVRAVLEQATERFGWGREKSGSGRGFGLACGMEKGSFVANCVEIAIDPGSEKVRVRRVSTAFECGAIVNPDHLKNQVEGAVMMGIGGALFETIEFDGSRITNPALSRYRVPRFADLPELSTVLVNRPDLDSAGAGETPIVTIAPAIRNAILAATGKALRALPLAPAGLQGPNKPA